MMLPRIRSGPAPRSWLFKLSVGLLATAIATLVRMAFDPVLHSGTPYITFFLGVVLAAWIGGPVGGVVAMVTGGLAADYFFVAPRFSLSFETLQSRVGVLLFTVLSTAVLVIVFRWRRTETALLRAQAVLAQAGEMAHLGAWAVEYSNWQDLNANPLYWSDETYRIFGHRPRSVPVTNELFFSQVHPDDRARVAEAVARAMADRRPYNFEHRIVRPDGTERIVHEHAEIEFDAEGRPCWMVGAVQDLTDQRRIEQTVREGSDRLRRIVEHIHDGLIIDDAEGRLVFANDRFLEMFGFDRGQFDRITLEDYVAPEHRALLRERHDRRLRGEDVPTQYECVGIARDGRRMWIEADVVPVLDDQGAIIGTQSALRDVTDRKRAEEALRASEETARRRAEELEKLMEVAPAAIWVAHDPECRTITGNRAANAVYEAHGGEEAGAGAQVATWRFFRDGVELPPEALPMQDAAARGVAVRDAEVQVRLPGGRTITILGNAIPLFAPDERVRGCIAAFIDITERKHLEGELRRKADELAEANRLKDEFIATVSHELRTPLNAMLGWAELLRERRLGAGPAQERAFAAISNNARRQAQLIEDLLDLSRIVAGKLRLEPRVIDPSPPVQAAIEAVLPSAEAKRIDVRVSAPRNAATVFADAARLQQVAWNLLTNAVKFTPSGGTVSVEVEPRGDRVEIRVRDTGAGIPPEFLPHVFDRFRQADSRYARAHGGLGIGLSIVRHLVEAQGGQVRAESAGVGEGATFVVTLPVRAAEDHRRARAARAPRKAALASPSSVPPPTLCGTRVLAVDDEPDARELASAVLRHYGAKVTTAESAAAALEALRRETPDVLLIDIAMPDIDGYALLHAIRELGDACAAIPAIALTAFAREEDRQRALASGFTLHLAKPVEESALVRAIASVCVPAPDARAE